MIGITRLWSTVTCGLAPKCSPASGSVSFLYFLSTNKRAWRHSVYPAPTAELTLPPRPPSPNAPPSQRVPANPPEGRHVARIRSNPPRRIRDITRQRYRRVPAAPKSLLDNTLHVSNRVRARTLQPPTISSTTRTISTSRPTPQTPTPPIPPPSPPQCSNLTSSTTPKPRSATSPP